MALWKRVAVPPSMPLNEVIAKIDESGLQVALVLAVDGSLMGVLTDGDVRRAILESKDFEIAVSEVMSVEPTTILESTPRDEMLALMRKKVIHHLPLLDEAGKVVGLITLDELIGVADHDNWAVIMAGGLGTRLQPLTNECPKPMLTVGGKPILETILESLIKYGFKRIFMSVNYKADIIRNHFGTGERWGVDITYLHEKTRLGTAGALTLLPEKPTKPIIVMNGDLLTHTNFDKLIQFHNIHNSTATMAVREYDFQVPYGVVQLDGTNIKAIEEKPVHKFFVNAGIYVLSPEALDYLPPTTYFDIPSLFDCLVKKGESTVAYPLLEYWLDIGRLEEFERAQREWVTEI